MSAPIAAGPWSYAADTRDYGDGEEVVGWNVYAEGGVKEVVGCEGILNDSDAETHARLFATAPDLLEAIEAEYTWLADIHHNWAGRHTASGQQHLCRLRDLICKVTGREPQDVQDDYGSRNSGATI